jgi:sulfoxide reductase catalytic subunit YedY
MLIKHASDIRSSEITPKSHYLDRRAFIRAAGTAAAAAGVGAFALDAEAAQPAAHGRKLENVRQSPLSTTGEKLNTWEQITTYNNFYEFGTDKESPSLYAKSLKTEPWRVVVEGEVAKPATYNLEDILKGETFEERVYRLRCVEAWSMVIPWVGFPLANFIKRVEPTSKAKFVEFTTAADSAQMPGVRTPALNWPYKEGLRMDEAMHPLTILGVGLYGEVLPKQNGAPLRLVVPWKYGFKSAKSIVRIRFVERQPMNSWQESQPSEYGFYSNVNPTVDHPRWTQGTERRIGEFFRRKTLMFNGYGDQVASLYAGMDLKRNY